MSGDRGRSGWRLGGFRHCGHRDSETSDATSHCVSWQDLSDLLGVLCTHPHIKTCQSIKNRFNKQDKNFLGSTSRAQCVGVSVPYILATETSAKQCNSFIGFFSFKINQCVVCQQCSSHKPLGVWQVASTWCSVPGTVRVPGKAALGTGLPIHTAAVEGDLGNTRVWSQVQLLLWGTF